MKNLFIFDVESTYLMGDGFAVGAVVYSPEGHELDRFELKSLEGEAEAGEWVQKNVIPFLKGMPTVKTNADLRNSFYLFYLKHKDSAEIWGDTVFPVETNFLAAVAKDDLEIREFAMPYPLKDVSTLCNTETDRAEFAQSKGATLRKHNPLDDAIASYILLKSL